MIKLLRCWGSGQDQLEKLEKPDWRGDSGLLHYWRPEAEIKQLVELAQRCDGVIVCSVNPACEVDDPADSFIFRTAAVALEYEGKGYVIHMPYGYGFSDSTPHYMFNDGNYACDCNLSKFIRAEYPDAVPELECGHSIKKLSLTIEYSDPANAVRFKEKPCPSEPV